MRVLILEDEAPAAERLQRLLESIDPASQVISVLETVEEGIEFLNGYGKIDLIISDVELADGLCFDVFSSTATKTPVIFTTAYNQYAIRAFEANAIDYLLKPVKEAELAKALDRVKERMNLEREDLDYQKLAEAIEQRKESQSKRYLVRYGQKMFVIDPNEAAYFYSEQKSSFMVNPEGKSFPLDESLTQVEADLNSKSFFRINRNFIVNVASIDEMITLGKARIKLKVNPVFADEETLMVAADRTPDFRKWLKG
jgi:DNA-binding LytR/AlgR family response regulator